MFKNLYILREYNNLSQEKLANILDVNKSIISRWETNKDIIPLQRLNMYSNYFNVSFDYLTGLSINKKNSIKLDNLDKQKIGKRIKKIRTLYNLSLRELAKELNTTASTISAYETGKNLILTAFAYQIAKNYQISLDWICGKSDFMEIE